MTTSQQPTPIDQRIAEEAAQWLIELDDASADRARFATWLAASPRHVEEFLLASGVWHAIDSIDDAREIDIGQLLASARHNVQPLEIATLAVPRGAGTAPGGRSPMRHWLAAAVAVFATSGVLWLGLADRGTAYVTSVGEQRAFKLPDGSLVTLNTRSHVVVRFEKHARIVELVAGEALFSVERDAQRPFRVLAGNAAVQAVGTQFNVHRAAEGTTVSVVEGIVKVSPLPPAGQRTDTSGAIASDHTEQLVAGEQAQVSPAGTLLRNSTAEIGRVMAWRERRLIFREEPLAAIATEFNRYNDTQLIVEGTATRARLMTGVFNADDPGALITFLDRDPALSVQSREDSVVIRGP